MSKKKRKAGREPRRDAVPPAAAALRPPRDISGALAAGILCLGFFAVGLVVDSGADNSFDAPKRLVAILFVAAAALAALGFARWTNPFATGAGRSSAPAIAAACLVI